ncbi:hypothetical protein C8R41DRAFT_982166 [Lentinula lateritia]|uniref:F-box domain-containing protein n=1 Tax=Lentinula lateritia TaxID=40482 RepID=A0ABQ8VCF5_9AGAR|nr:hypothetical protein C8R41DRAFT_982166 [Lentinula lateritia]
MASDPQAGIHALPNEILCQIFIFVVTRAPGEYSASELDLSFVCSRWRAVALSLCQLWSSICILAHEDPESEGVRHLTELSLERSGNSPLDLFLNLRKDSSVMHMLYAQAHRWRHVHIITTVYHDLEDRGVKEFPLLESLSLSMNDSPPYPVSSNSRMWSNAPRLHTLSLDMTVFELEQFAVPWHQLRHLTLEYSDLDQMHKALCLCTSVVTAGFDSCTNDFSFRDPVAYTCLFLSSLTIVASHRLETLGPDITRCIYPSLSILTLISGSQEFSFSHVIVPDLTSLVIRSECHLTSLTLHGISYSSKHLMALIQATSSSLIKLDLCDVDHLAETAPIASYLQTPGHLLPHLKEFGIRFPASRRDFAIDREKIGLVLGMIESRCSSSALGARTDSRAMCVLPGKRDTSVGEVLERLHLGRLWSTRVPSEFEKRLRALEDNGLKITAL